MVSSTAIPLQQSKRLAKVSVEPSRAVVVVALALIVLFFAAVRYRLHNVPLERDEGEYAYSGQLMLQGIPPYELAYNMKLPGIYAAYAGIMAVLGETPAGIHLGLLLINLVTVLLMYLLAAQLFGRLAGMVAAASYAVLSTSASVMGFEAHATNFVVLPAILGILLLLRAQESGGNWLLFASGVCGGIAVLMKQHGAFFVVFCLLFQFFGDPGGRIEWRKFTRQGAIYLAGVIVPYAATCLLLYRAGVFHRFWFWTVSYAGEYSKMGLRRAIRAFFENSAGVVKPAALMWVLAVVGFSALWWSPIGRRQARFLKLLFLCSLLSLCPGAFFRPHYYILILPVAALLVGLAVTTGTAYLSGENTLRRYAPALIFLICFGATIFIQRKDYFGRSPMAVFESIYPEDPFVAAQQVARYIRDNSVPADRIAVIGSEPEIYLYAQRHSATGYLYMYSLIVRQKYTSLMRRQFLEELEANQPKYLIYVDVWNSWGERNVPPAEPFLADLQKYMKTGYERVGVADIAETTEYVWGDKAASYLPRSSRVIYVLRKTGSAQAQ